MPVKQVDGRDRSHLPIMCLFRVLEGVPPSESEYTVTKESQVFRGSKVMCWRLILVQI